jgi:alanyl-tRNA synthetase
MKTQPIYLDDSYIKEMYATILEVHAEAHEKWRVLLDKTVFYPMGGGQSTDQGMLVAKDWQANVYMAMMKDGELWHYVTATVKPEVGMIVQGTINWERRRKNMRLHSAGHVIDFAMHLLGHSPSPLSPLKADHSKKPYIVYQGKVDKDIKEELEKKANELIGKNLQFSWNFQSLEELKKEAIYLQPNLPTSKPLRTLRLETVGAVADGGTIVRYTKEIGQVIITEVEVKENETVVRYSIVPA